jgi:branched-subunit amino acid transport protein
MNEFVLIAGMALATMATRIPVLMLLSRRQMPQAIFRALRYVPPAVLSAIIFPAVLRPGGDWHFGLDNAALIGSLVAATVAWRSRNLLLTIVVGMAVLWIWRALLGG